LSDDEFSEEKRMATDFRSGRDFPRRGREEYGGFVWLLRVSDKARAAANGTIHDYIYPCPMDRGVFERWGISSEQFDAALATHVSDEALLRWLRERVSDERREFANAWVLQEKASNLDRQDAEEGVVPV
jgi:hypothetical protein